MSYCVNCGVKLADSEAVCPLCQTPVINPSNTEKSHSTYPDQIDQFPKRKINRLYVLKLTWIVMGIVSLALILCDVITTGSVGWSIYAVSGVLYISGIASAFTVKSAYISVFLGTVSTLLFLAVISWLSNGWKWFLYLAAPFTLIIGIYIMICAFLIKKKSKSLLRAIAICLLLCVFALIGIEILIDLYGNQQISLFWSVYAAIPIGVISLGLLLVSFNRRLLSEIKKRAFL